MSWSRSTTCGGCVSSFLRKIVLLYDKNLPVRCRLDRAPKSCPGRVAADGVHLVPGNKFLFEPALPNSQHIVVEPTWIPMCESALRSANGTSFSVAEESMDSANLFL